MLYFLPSDAIQRSDAEWSPSAPAFTAISKGIYTAYCSPPQHSETREELVVYQALYGEQGYWVRPAAMWLETINRDGYTGPRFTWVEL